MDNIRLCKRCTKRKFDYQKGLICSLTNEKPDFADECPDFERDETIKVYFKAALRPNTRRAKIAQLFIWIVLALEIVSLISNTMQYNLLQWVMDGNFVTDQELELNDSRQQIIAGGYLFFFIVSGITFIMWFKRAYFNLHQRVRNLSYTEGWAIGAWFVPIISLYRPYKIMKELYEETKKLLKKSDLLHFNDLSTIYLGYWWALWIISGILTQIYYRFPVNTIQNFSDATMVDIFSNILGIPLALITIKIIKDYAKFEPKLKEL